MLGEKTPVYREKFNLNYIQKNERRVKQERVFLRDAFNLLYILAELILSNN